jgi:prepilin-type N-terminal cleavage/methylation domain-containing protein/prepilin-type processing-associated H-X9-DG protein
MHTNKPSDAARKRGFSLYEVIIAVAIVSIATALLVPAVAKAKKAATGMQCAGNLRGWGIAFQLYAADNRGFYPFGWINNSDHWLSFMAPYVEERWMSYDPVTFAKRMDRKKAGCPVYAKFQHPDPLFRAFPYSYNAARFDYPFSSPASFVRGNSLYPAGWRAGINWDPYGVAHRYNGMTNVETRTNVSPTQLYTKPVHCVTMFCGLASTWRYMSTPYAWWFSGGGGADWDIRTGDSAATGTNPTEDAAGSALKAFDYNGAPTGVHNGSDNYLFMDGHVETLDLNNPNLSRFVYNQIPNNNNPYR